VAQLFIDDMNIPNAVKPMGIRADWASKPRVGLKQIPEGWSTAIMWGQIYAGQPGNPAQNVRVQIRDCALWMLSRKDGSWHLLSHAVTSEGAAYREDFAGDVSIPAAVRKESDGSIAVKLVAGHNYHFWPASGRVAVVPADIEGMASCFFARLVVDDATKPDDRDQARLVGSCGGDYWRSTDAAWKSDYSNNGDWAIGRFKVLTKDWQPITCCTVGGDVLRTNPPPIQAVWETKR
jgi:hypothetical protein